MYKVVDCTVNSLMCHVDSVGLNPLGTRGPTEILKPRSRWWKANSSPVDHQSIKFQAFPNLSGCSLRNVLNTAHQAVTSSQPELAEDEAYSPFPKQDESV